MAYSVTRREFLACSAAVAATAALADPIPAATTWKTRLHKALIGKPTEEILSQWKAAGFEGIESNDRKATPEEAAQARKVAERLGMPIHSVLYGWANFNSPDKSQVEAEIESVAAALQSAGAAGAQALLLVPCKVTKIAMPEAWEFDIEFDPKTCHVKRVVQGDNSKYAEYIQAQNYATDSSRAAVQKLITAAEKAKVIIALENVWNNLWVKPALAKAFIESFGNPWVRSYYDIGNHVKYAPPEEWIRTLGRLIVKVHIKDFKLNPDGHGGKFVDIRDGSVNWPVVRQALDDVGYNGWLTIEGSERMPLAERSKRLDLIIAGK